jgi:hypothetical protein
MVRRYPRQFWEYPGGGRFLLTTQRGDHDYSPSAPQGRLVADWLSGSICRVDVGSAEAHCFAEGKAHGIAESRRRNRVYVAMHGAQQGTVYALPGEGPFRPLAEANVPGKAAGIYVDDEADIVGVFEDDAERLHTLRASDLTFLGSQPAPFLPDAVHYDQQLRRGIACAAAGPMLPIDGQAFASVAFDGVPFSYRLLAPSSQYPSSWLAMTWGCDWDPSARRAYVAVATLGLLEVIDYDTGRILDRSFMGPGIRTVAFDAGRRRIYAAFFLRGDVIAMDLDNGAVVDHWFVGRFVRHIALSRDRNSLLATSNVGIVRIPLAAVPDGHPSAVQLPGGLSRVDEHPKHSVEVFDKPFHERHRDQPGSTSYRCRLTGPCSRCRLFLEGAAGVG